MKLRNSFKDREYCGALTANIDLTTTTMAVNHNEGKLVDNKYMYIWNTVIKPRICNTPITNEFLKGKNIKNAFE